ncbi:MAG: glycosyltransferase family 39 protein [Owenweeksia sp.]|nr:glycosyltransferase family 39 protein [Owenweeksia sp.]
MNRINFIWLWSLASLVYILGLGVGIKDVNSAQCAALSREMLETGQFLKLQLYGEHYLDKPPLFFWINTLFFNAFGYANWSFKIGAFLFSTLGAYGTFRAGKLLYNASTGRLAALILYTSQAFFLLNNVVRTDTVLLACVIIAIWQMLEWLHSHRWKWLLGASVFLAMAMLAKGMVGLVVPLVAVGCYLLGKRRWREFLRWQYLVGLGVIFLVISPFLWGLHQQFDLQPEQGVMVPTSGGMQYRTDVSGFETFFLDPGSGPAYR